MYCKTNFRTKKALKEALARGEQIGVFQPGPFGSKAVGTGSVALEGPWFPEAHKWWASAEVVNGLVVKVK